VRETIVIVLAVIGLAFSLTGALGIWRLPDVYSRIQSSSMVTTMGALPALIALVVAEGPVSSYGSRALLVAVLLLVLSPVAAHALARAAYKVGIPQWPGAVTDQVRDRTARSAPAKPSAPSQPSAPAEGGGSVPPESGPGVLGRDDGADGEAGP
jgi:multicomponent Na+:H+ antiporter subunit G